MDDDGFGSHGGGVPSNRISQPVMAPVGGSGGKQLAKIFGVMLLIVAVLVGLSFWGMYNG